MLIMSPPEGATAVIFVSQREQHDEGGYGAAADAMVEAAARQPGYLGIHSVRDASGFGMTISYWASDADAQAWKRDPAHSRIRELGRAKWYDWYETIVARVERSYDWQNGRAEDRR
jgi:heme-degrading monooxygenase HmoA